MSARFNRQDATGVIVRDPTRAVMSILKTTTPTNGVAGFGTGCLWVNQKGTVGTVLYVNVGTKSSTTWVNIA